MGILLNFASKFVLNGKFDALQDTLYILPAPTFVATGANLTSDV